MTMIKLILGLIWASPYTLLVLLVGAIGLLTGGRAQIRGQTVEFYGGGTKWFVTHLPLGETTLAFTLGHTILGQSKATLSIARDHELVHVRQRSLFAARFRSGHPARGEAPTDPLVEYIRRAPRFASA